MRTLFIEVEKRYDAKKIAPWANSVAKVCGGFIAFESISDFKIWRGQK